jgi:hypothetical protein
MTTLFLHAVQADEDEDGDEVGLGSQRQYRDYLGCYQKKKCLASPVRDQNYSTPRIVRDGTCTQFWDCAICYQTVPMLILNTEPFSSRPQCPVVETCTPSLSMVARQLRAAARPPHLEKLGDASRTRILKMLMWFFFVVVKFQSSQAEKTTSFQNTAHISNTSKDHRTPRT